MPRYTYTAVDTQNKKVKAAVEARDEADLRRMLRKKGLVPIRYSAVRERHSGYRLKANETSELSRQLAGMLSSGITLIRAMEILKERDFKPQLRHVYGRLYRDVLQGSTLSEAMRMQKRAFPELLINMYATGEASGQLENVAHKMAVQYDKEHKLNKKIRSAMTYPATLFVTMVIVVMIIFGLILPRFFILFEDMQMPPLTRGVMAISMIVQKRWYLLIIGFLVIIAGFEYLMKIKGFALCADRIKLLLPVIGGLLKTIYTARFARTLSSLYSSGLSIINALEITATIIGNTYIAEQFDVVVKDIRNGIPLSEAVGKVDGFDKKLSITILIGEESGRLDTMLESTAESFDYEAETAAGQLVQLIEPVMIAVMAVAICIIMLSVMMPLMTLYQNAESIM